MKNRASMVAFTLLPLAFATTPVTALAKTYVWNTAVTSGNVSSNGCWLVDAREPTTPFTAADDVVIDPVGVNALSTLDTPITCRSFVLSNRATVYGNASVTAEKLVAGVGYSKLRCASALFGAFETRGYVGTIGVLGGKVRFTDTSSVPQVGGVLPNFAIIQDNNITAANGLFYTPYGICRLDANGYVVEYPVSEMHQGLPEAGEEDTVYVNASTTLEEDLTINALYNAGAINLNGHALTVKSGVIRSGKWGGGILTNGTLVVGAPILYVDGLNNNSTRWRCSIVLAGNADPMKSALASVSAGGAFPDFAPCTQFVGRVLAPKGQGFSSACNSSGAFWDIGKGGNLASIGSNLQSCNLLALAGAGTVTASGYNAKFYLGTRPAEETWENCTFVLGSNGVFSVGSLAYDGSRVGDAVFADPLSNIKAYQKLLIKPGGTLGVTVRADGSATCLKTEGTSSYRTRVTIAGGKLEVAEVGKVTSGTWTVMRTVDPVVGHAVAGAGEGFFDSVPALYKIRYNVEVEEEGVTYYEIQLTRRTGGFRLSLR